MPKHYIGIDLGGKTIKFGCFDENLVLIEKASLPANSDMGADAIIDTMVDASKSMLSKAELSLDDVTAVGLGSPGPALYSEGILLEMVNIPNFRGVPVRDILSKRLFKPVAFDNDANVACWGEYTAGIGKGVDDMVFFTLGTGIGCGIISGGRLLSGAGDNIAELGHITVNIDGRKCSCGQKDCIEAYASASNTARRAVEAVRSGRQSSLEQVLKDKGEITCKDVYDHLEKGDALAKLITDETARSLAVMCVNALHFTEPVRIVFAGKMTEAGSPLLDRIRYYFDQLVWNLKKEPIEICFAKIGRDAGIIGAAAMARYNYQ